MNNPAAVYPPQGAYSHGNPLMQGHLMSPPSINPQAQVQAMSQGGLPPNAFQRQQQLPPNIQALYQQQLQQNAAFMRPQSRGNPMMGSNGNPMAIQMSQPNPMGGTMAISQPQQMAMSMGHQRQQSNPPNNINQQTSSTQANTNQVVATQNQHATPQSNTSSSPQSAAREKARVSVLLEINTYLLQEVVSLQSQGKAGGPPSASQQSPTSPTSGSDPGASNSPTDPSKPSKPASPEYAECMRRLQANFAYLVAIADSKRKSNGALPAAPAILTPPPHLKEVHDLYRKLITLFPQAPRSNNPGLGVSNQHPNQALNSVSAQG